MPIPTILWQNNGVKLIDQRKLPLKVEYVYCRDVKSLWGAIKTLTVRGAPVIGVAAAFGVLLGIKEFSGQSRKIFAKKMKRLCQYIGSSRPTAVNLFYALQRMEAVLKNDPEASVKRLKTLLKGEAFSMFEEDRVTCRKIGDHGARLIKNGDRLMTICNTGALATVDYGTALGVMYSAKKQDKKFSVYVCETRPLLQGARLTMWELKNENIPATLLCDNMAATLMKQGKIDGIFTGADRIAANGDAANKIGTYNLAVLANYHRVPFYVVAPLSTFDGKIKSGKDIPIEQRNENEVLEFAGVRSAPKGVKAYNPAFDVTDHKLISAIVTEYGIIKPPFERKIRKVLRST